VFVIEVVSGQTAWHHSEIFQVTVTVRNIDAVISLRVGSDRHLSDTAEAAIGPVLRVLDLHDIADPFREVGRAAMPGLVIGQVDVARFAEDRFGPMPLKF
jgi:hypothetical protein